MQSSTSEVRVVPLSEHSGGADVLTDILRQGAQKLLAQAIEAEVADWIDAHKEVGLRELGNNPLRQRATPVSSQKNRPSPLRHLPSQADSRCKSAHDSLRVS